MKTQTRVVLVSSLEKDTFYDAFDIDTGEHISGHISSNRGFGINDTMNPEHEWDSKKERGKGREQISFSVIQLLEGNAFRYLTKEQGGSIHDNNKLFGMEYENVDRETLEKFLNKNAPAHTKEVQ